MSLRDFAERVLFSTSLEEKLMGPPPGIVDRNRGAALNTPEVPARPEGLELRLDSSRADFPGISGIENDLQRGRLLHFFANHELLATELMALVLLKFPDAPAEFREGILHTLKEEQMHTKLYLRRMAQCGVEFGELPVNGFFWKTVSSMKTPLDYVTRLSLTFEQANLDYARGYAAIFAEAGDMKTASVLERIYSDEVRHVGYGLKWFRRWRQSNSDWQQFVSGLDLPLSPARAKGAFGFNEEGRREAGFDEDFIKELRVCGQSRGRTPNVFWFNPGGEESLVAGTNNPSRATLEIGRDLALLPAYLARREDVLIVPSLPPIDFLSGLLDAGIDLPELVPCVRIPELKKRKLNEIRPWAHTPDAESVIEGLGAESRPVAPDLFSKLLHADFLGGLIKENTRPFICGIECVGTRVSSVDEIQDWAEKSSFKRCVIKAPFSTAGRQRVVCIASEVGSREKCLAIRRLLSRHGSLLIEPWLDRIRDFSMHYDMTSRGLVRRGLVVLENTRRGQFRRALVTNRFTDTLEKSLRRALFEGASPRGHLVDFQEAVLEPGLKALLREHDFIGPIGVDSFFYRDLSGSVRWKPVVEMNPRYTMGRVALEVSRFGNLKKPLSLTIAPVDRRPADSVPLTPIDQETKWGAFLGSSLAE